MKQISLRVDKNLVKKTEELSDLENTDKSVILRKALKKGIDELSEKVVVELYKENKVSLSEAAELTGLGAGELMDLLKKHGLKSKITVEDFEKGEEIADKLV